jgi:radical SAM/Cys-rich protein
MWSIKCKLQPYFRSIMNLSRGNTTRMLSSTFNNNADDETSVKTHEHVLKQSKSDIERQKRRRLLALNNLQIEKGVGLIEQTLDEMKNEQVVKMTTEERKLKRRSLEGLPSFDDFLPSKLQRKETKIFQINIGLYCNQACSHCHVESSPKKLKEQMSKEIVNQCLKVIENSPGIDTVDITGGAPELNANFRYLIEQLRADSFANRNLDIIDRCNLTVLSEPGQEHLADFLARHKVHVIASLPCYGSKNVDQQRGNGVFDRSISGLLKLNDLGYGYEGTGLKLDLVYNPIGPFLPPDQNKLESQYKKELDEKFGIQFNTLFCITNMPIKVSFISALLFAFNCFKQLTLRS